MTIYAHSKINHPSLTFEEHWRNLHIDKQFHIQHILATFLQHLEEGDLPDAEKQLLKLPAPLVKAIFVVNDETFKRIWGSSRTEVLELLVSKADYGILKIIGDAEKTNTNVLTTRPILLPILADIRSAGLANCSVNQDELKSLWASTFTFNAPANPAFFQKWLEYKPKELKPKLGLLKRFANALQAFRGEETLNNNTNRFNEEKAPKAKTALKPSLVNV